MPAYNATAPDRHIGAQLMAVSGPLARSIPDIALALSAMSAADPRDPWYAPAPAGSDFPKRAALTLAPDGMPVAGEVRTALLDAADRLKAAGWTVEERPCPPIRAAAALNATLWMADTQFGAAAAIAKEADPDALFVFAQMSRDAGEVGFASLMEALQARAALIREWELFAQDYPVLICPVSGELPFEQQSDVRSEADFARIYEAQLTQRGLPVMGMPALTVTTGSAQGCPVGVQLVGPRFREDILLAAGLAIEAAGEPIGIATPDWS